VTPRKEMTVQTWSDKLSQKRAAGGRKGEAKGDDQILTPWKKKKINIVKKRGKDSRGRNPRRRNGRIGWGVTPTPTPKLKYTPSWRKGSVLGARGVEKGGVARDHPSKRAKTNLLVHKTNR